MTALATLPREPIPRRVADLLRMLASPHDAEVLATVRALQRTIDLHTLGDLFEHWFVVLGGLPKAPEPPPPAPAATIAAEISYLLAFDELAPATRTALRAHVDGLPCACATTRDYRRALGAALK